MKIVRIIAAIALFALVFAALALIVKASPPQDMLAKPPQDMLVAVACECPVGGFCICGNGCTCLGCACPNCPGKKVHSGITETIYGPFDTPPWATQSGGWKKNMENGWLYHAKTGWYYHAGQGYYHPQQRAYQLSTVPMQGMMFGGFGGACAGGG